MISSLAEPQEHWTTWLARKTHRTHFRDRVNKSSYQPKTNTAVLLEYEGGLGEALELLKSASVRIFDKTKEEATYADIYAMGALRHAIDYLKGKDLNPQLSATRTLQDENSSIWTPRPQNDFEESVEKNKDLLRRLPDEPKDFDR